MSQLWVDKSRFCDYWFREMRTESKPGTLARLTLSIQTMKETTMNILEEIKHNTLAQVAIGATIAAVVIYKALSLLATSLGV